MIHPGTHKTYRLILNPSCYLEIKNMCVALPKNIGTM